MTRLVTSDTPAGTLVTCVDSAGYAHQITEGKRYVLVCTYAETGRGLYAVLKVNDRRRQAGYRAARFAIALEWDE